MRRTVLWVLGLMVAFPALVTGGIEKTQSIDADKALEQLQMAPREEQDNSNAFGTAEPASAPGGAASEPGKDDKEDPMKGLMESIQKDAPKKP